jgi:hypothetical protein
VTKNIVTSLRLIAAIATASLALCDGALARTTGVPANFLYMGSGELEKFQAILKRPDIEGVQIVYNWKSLEPSLGQYDFSAIERDLATTDALGKKLFIQIQDRFFSVGARRVPNYLMTELKYGGGLAAQNDNAGAGQPTGHGWVAMQWNSAVRERYQALLNLLAEKFDGKVFGVNLPETAADIDIKRDQTGFSCDAYFDAEMSNLAAARAAFAKSHVVQYVNFWPCEWANDHKYMERIFAYAADHSIGLGGPDIVPNRKGQMKNSYPYFHDYRGKLSLVAMAVQEPDLTYKNQKTGKPFTKDEFTQFAQNYLGADLIFWSASSPWLKH